MTMAAPTDQKLPVTSVIAPLDVSKSPSAPTPGGEIVAALVGVADLIDGEIIQVPHDSLLHVRPPRFRRDSGGDLAARQVSQLVDYIDTGRLEERRDMPTRHGGQP